MWCHEIYNPADRPLFEVHFVKGHLVELSRLYQVLVFHRRRISVRPTQVGINYMVVAVDSVYPLAEKECMSITILMSPAE